jgi:hypothetical protein
MERLTRACGTFTKWERTFTSSSYPPLAGTGCFVRKTDPMNMLKTLKPAFALSLLISTVACMSDTGTSGVLAMANAPVTPQEEPVPAPPVTPVPPGAKTILLGLLLDTSNSMDGLISQAKAQLWNIVNKLSEARCDGQRPTVRVALYEYGNAGLPMTGNYIRQVSPFTLNMDEISKQLFALTTNGGDEYCGAVLAKSLDELDWSSEEGDLRIIFIAGNEPFTQGPISFATSCERARQKGIVVNTIFCGDHREGINTSWQAGALAAKGDYFSIDQDAITMQVASPYDGELAQLNVGLNDNGIYYGQQGTYNWENNAAQDKNAESLGFSSCNSRVKYKANNGWSNSSWDLTEVETGKLDSVLARVDRKTLPEKYRGADAGLLKAEVTRQREVKEASRARIVELMRLREAYVADYNKKAGITNELENAVLASLERMATAKGFKFEEPKVKVAPPVEKEKTVELKKKDC